MGSPGVVTVVLAKWGSLAKAPKVTSSGGLDVDLEVGGGLPSQAASHVASEQSTFVPNEQSIVTWLLPKCLTATINIPHLEKLPWTSLRTALAANLRTNLPLLLGPMSQLEMMGLAIFLPSG